MPPKGFSRAQIALHWAVAALMVVSFVSHEAMESLWRALAIDPAAAVTTGAVVHVVTGLSILTLVVWRIALRLRRGAPAQAAGTPAWAERAARLGHGALYAILLAIPVTGALAWFGGLTALGEVHGVLFGLCFLLVLGHVLVALFHHYVLKDGLLRRMARPE